MTTYNPDLEQVLERLRKGEMTLPDGYIPPTSHHHHDSFTTLRQAQHRGKKIEIHTTYRILIDGEPLQTHTAVLNNGKVHTHGLPQYAFSSAIDMVKKIIDTLAAELPENQLHASGNGHKGH